MINPTVSVIVPTYNCDRFLARCIRSLLNNSIKRSLYEIIVVDDGSNDKTQEILSVFKNQIIIIKNNHNLGLPSSLNIGINNARGQFIVRVDADDYVHKDYLYILMLHLQLNNNIDAVACDYYIVNDIQDKIEYVDFNKKPIGCGIMFRTDQLIDIGLYDKNFILREDEDLILRFKKKYKLTYLKIPLYRYHIHGKNMTLDKIGMNKYKKKLIKKHNK